MEKNMETTGIIGGDIGIIYKDSKVYVRAILG